MSISLVVNGDTQHLSVENVAGLLAALDLPRTKIAVELNREIVPRSRYDDTPLGEGDQIEIVQFVGGG